MHQKIKKILFPYHETRYGYKDPGLNNVLLKWLHTMQLFLWLYIDEKLPHHGAWTAALEVAAFCQEHGVWFAHQLQQWSFAFIESGDLPYNIYGTWNKSMLDDEDLQNEIMAHLQSLGKYISVSDLQEYINRSDVQAQFGIKKKISL
ncbi:hypothetical protein AN958_12229 [Leucoagaricus sp. SymC.cos]|nr:hypothetical protein AN958_12229 [Leucoagaricus sp. SymC.cos]